MSKPCVTCKSCKYNFTNPDSIGWCTEFNSEAGEARKSCRGAYWSNGEESSVFSIFVTATAVVLIACICLTGCAMNVEVKGIGFSTVFDPGKFAPVLKSMK